MNDILAQIPLYQKIIVACLMLTFLIQMVYWLRYASVSTHRHTKRFKDANMLPPVSIIVIVSDNVEQLEQALPALLTQEHPQYEVVVVNDCGGDDMTMAIEEFARQYPHLKYTVIKPDLRFKHSRKIPLVVGIKAAQYEHLLFTDLDATPRSPKWASFMARGFAGSDVVISYAGLEQHKGMANRLIRACRMVGSLRYLRAAISGHTYRGTLYNMGYTKQVFFENKGFTHLRLALGEDDLFVQRIASKDNVAVIINPQTTVEQSTWGGLGWWWRYQKYVSYSFRYYPTRVKTSIFVELLSQSLFFILSLGLVVLAGLSYFIYFDFAFAIAMISIGGGSFVLRQAVMLGSCRAVAQRLGEKKILWGIFVYDLFAPVSQAMLAIARRIKPAAGLWI